MTPSKALRQARRRRGLSQRDLARLAGVAQPVVARIESGAVTPRVDTLARFLDLCGESLEVRPKRGIGVDRSMIRELLRLSPGERLRVATETANNLAGLPGAAR